MGVRLPPEYQEVEYLKATGTQYIQTSYTPQNADEIVCDFAVVGSIVGASNAQALFAAGTGTNQLIFLLNNTSGANPVNGAYYKYFASGDAARLFFYPSYDTKYRLEIGNDGTANCNGYSVQSNYEGAVNTALRLMQRPNGRSSFKGKCYQFILSNGGEEKLHLISCYRKSDSKPGMYDLVSDTFFTNAGTGEFEVGPDVIDSISPLMVAWRRIMMAAASVAKKLVKLIATSTTGLVSFTTNVIRPVKVTCEFSPVQEGTGDPSPDNVRPISGWTGANIYNEETYDASATPKLTINWQSEAGTVYGGTVTLNDDGSVDVVANCRYAVYDGDENWKWSTKNGRYNANIAATGIYRPPRDSLYAIPCNYAKPGNNSVTTYFAVGATWQDSRIYFFNPTTCLDGVEDLATFKAYLTQHPLEVVYPLVTPQTYHFDNIGQLQSFLGTNNIWHNMNGSITAEYYKKQ